MGTLRQTVLPVLRLLVWTVIAVALCVIAFGRGGSSDTPTDPLTPTGDVSDPTVAVARGDISSTMALTGSVGADPATTVRATAAGVVGRVLVSPGSAVAPGTPVLQVVQSLDPVEQPVVTAPDGTTTQAPPRTRTKTVTVTAGTTGTVTSVAVLKDQDVSVGTDVATVSPGTLTVTAPLTQAQQFRLLHPPASARAQARGGPAPFSCTDLRTGLPDPDEQQPAPSFDPATGQPAVAPSAQVTCRVPGGTTVFPGMSVDLTLDLGSAEGVLVVPVTAVLGTVGTGSVWVAGGDGEPTERKVALGLTDGTQVEVREGLAEGDQVLQYAPAPSDDDPVAAGGASAGVQG